jgi:hypothetical protein
VRSARTSMGTLTATTPPVVPHGRTSAHPAQTGSPVTDMVSVSWYAPVGRIGVDGCTGVECSPQAAAMHATSRPSRARAPVCIRCLSPLSASSSRISSRDEPQRTADVSPGRVDAIRSRQQVLCVALAEDQEPSIQPGHPPERPGCTRARGKSTSPAERTIGGPWRPVGSSTEVKADPACAAGRGGDCA